MFEELKASFINEVKELLENTEKNLLLLENESENIDYVQEIFRSMHTIKGSAGVYGLDRTVELAHNFENIFSKIRDKKLQINNDIISLALEAIDIILELIQADSEDKVPIERTQKITEKINKIQILENTDNQAEKNQTKSKKFFTYYILFEPNVDIEERGIKIETVISDFDEFEHKIITKIIDETRSQAKKLPVFYEIIVAATYSIDEIKAIFLFTPMEVTITKIADFNVFNDENFVDFYENAVRILPFSEQRLSLIQNFCDNSQLAEQQETDVDYEAEKIVEEKKLSEIKIGEDEIQKYIEESKEKNLQFIKIPADKLDDLLNLVSELIISNSQLSESLQKKDYTKINRLVENIDKTINNIKENTLNLRLIPIKTILPPYYRVVRDLSQKLNKKIEFIGEGIDTQVDKTIVDKLSVPLMHIIRNSIDHGIETPEDRINKGKSGTGIIRFIAYHSNSNVIIQIQDDGQGINPDHIRKKAIERGFIRPETKLSKKEIYELLFLPGFTTTEEVTDISGRGIGMDAIKKAILDLRGDIEIDSEVDLGTSVTIKLPLTLSIIEALHVSAGKMNFLIPMSDIVACKNFDTKQIKQHSGERIILDDKIIPYLNINKIFNLLESKIVDKKLILVKHGKQTFGMLFDQIHGEYQAVIKNLGSIFNNLDFVLGVSILGNGDIAYILDSYKLLKQYGKKTQSYEK